MRLVAALLPVLVASVNPPPEDAETRAIPHHREGDWQRLGHPTPTRLGSETFIIGKELGWFSVLRIERLWGTVKLQQVKVVRGHSSETFNVNVRLDEHHTATYINLGRPRTIDEITVHADPTLHGSYAIYGSSTAPRPEVAY